MKQKSMGVGEEVFQAELKLCKVGLITTATKPKLSGTLRYLGRHFYTNLISECHPRKILTLFYLGMR